MDIKGKRVFITGAARRLGRAMAVHLAAKGCDIVAHYRHSRDDAESLKSETGCGLFQCDFENIALDDLKKRLNNEVGDVSILINNASSFGRSNWDAISEEFWNREISVNLKVPFFLMQHFGSIMKNAGEGKIVNMADIAADKAYLNYLPYSVAKAGLVSLTRAMARALSPEVQVNAIAPGTILFVENMSEEAKQKLIKNIPAHRTGAVAELLETIDFLISSVDYITGQTIVLDGGRSLTW